jgi:predicted  nucleic acid-binding Zn-ribbon protein
MSIQKSLETLVCLQSRELELREIGLQMEELARQRAALDAEIRAAEDRVEAAGADLENSRAEVRHMELDLQGAEENVGKSKAHILDVKTNEELWALQKQIDTAQGEVGALEEKIIEQMERADEIEARIGVRRAELAEVTERVQREQAAADAQEVDLARERTEVEAAISDLREHVPADLLHRYEDVKRVRRGVAVAEIVEEICQACHVTVRPQLYVETLDLQEIHGCENCGRIMFVRETLSIPASVLAPKEANGAADKPEPTP